MTSHVRMYHGILVCDRCKASRIVTLPAPVKEFLAECMEFEREHEGCGEKPAPTIVERAQKLYWEVEALRALRAERKSVVPKLIEMGELHESLGRELLPQGRHNGWIDLFAAVTAWAEAGRFERATSLLDWSLREVPRFDGTENLQREIARMRAWVDQTRRRIPPSLAEFARPLPSRVEGRAERRRARG